MTTIHTHDEHTTECIVSFPSVEDMDRAIGLITYDSTDGFSGVDEYTIEISKEQCQMLEKDGISYKHIK